MFPGTKGALPVIVLIIFQHFACLPCSLYHSSSKTCLSISCSCADLCIFQFLLPLLHRNSIFLTCFFMIFFTSLFEVFSCCYDIWITCYCTSLFLLFLGSRSLIFSCQEIKALFDLDCVSLLKVPVCLQFGPFGSGWPFGRFACPETKLYPG